MNFLRKKLSRKGGSKVNLSSSDEEGMSASQLDPTTLTKYTVYKMWCCYSQGKKKPPISDFVNLLLYDSNLKVKKLRDPTLCWADTGELVWPLSEEEQALKDKLEEAKQRLNDSFRAFKAKYFTPKNRELVKFRGDHANDTFFDLKVDEYSDLIDEEASQQATQQSGPSCSQGSTSSTKSWVEQHAAKPRPKTRKQFRDLCPAFKREKTDDIYKRLMDKADELNCSFNELLANLGYRYNYISNKKVAKAFAALANNELERDLSLDKALFVKFRYNFSRRAWTDFRIDFEYLLNLPTHDELTKYMEILCPKSKMIPIKQGWRMSVQDVVESTLKRLPKDVSLRYILHSITIDRKVY